MNKSIITSSWNLLLFLSGLLLTTANTYAQSKVESEPDVMPYLASCENSDKEEQQNCSNKILLKMVYGAVKYPESAMKAEAEGVAVLDFVIEKNGSIGKVALHKSTNNAALDAEALRVLEAIKAKGKIWKPGMTKGKKVATAFKLPLKFKLQ